MGEINLLSKELKVSGLLSSKLETIFKKILIFLVSFLILVFVLGGGFYAFLSYKNNLLISENKKLLSEVSALESTEQKLFFLKDRVLKVSKVLSDRDVSNAQVNFQEILGQIDQKAKIKKFEIKANEINFDLGFEDILTSEKFVKYLRESGKYSRIDLKSYFYNSSESIKYNASYLLIIN